MLTYVLICLCLSLAGVTGLQFLYLAYLDRIDKDQKKRIYELERHCQKLSVQLEIAEKALEESEAKEEDEETEEVVLVDEDDNEVWADVLE